MYNEIRNTFTFNGAQGENGWKESHSPSYLFFLTVNIHQQCPDFNHY